jgi:hypothetical protein
LEAKVDREPSIPVNAVLAARRSTYPPEKTVAAAAQSDTDRLAAALEAVGFSRDRVEIISVDEVKGSGSSHGEPGLYRLAVRLDTSLVDDLDELERARQDLASGYALVQVRILGNEERVRVHAILNGHGSHATHYFGRWTVMSGTHR